MFTAVLVLGLSHGLRPASRPNILLSAAAGPPSKSLWSRYTLAAEQHPMTTKMATAFVLACAGDAIAQQIEGASALSLRRMLVLGGEERELSACGRPVDHGGSVEVLGGAWAAVALAAATQHGRLLGLVALELALGLVQAHAARAPVAPAVWLLTTGAQLARGQPEVSGAWGLARSARAEAQLHSSHCLRQNFGMWNRGHQAPCVCTECVLDLFGVAHTTQIIS